jgi:hypothetical protein
VKKTLLLATLISLSFITVLAQQPAAVHPESGTWIKVAPENSGFVVQMPGKPAEKAEPVAGHPGLENHLLTFETALGGYVVSYLQFPDEITDPDLIKVMLDSGREVGLSRSGGELISETNIKLSGFMGREWNLKLPPGLTAIARAYWVKNRLYQTIFVMSPRANDTEAEIKLRQQAQTKFLNSFALSGENK